LGNDEERKLLASELEKAEEAVWVTISERRRLIVL
jgi:hypothetical protein